MRSTQGRSTGSGLRNCLCRSPRYWKRPGLGLQSPGAKRKNGPVKVIVQGGKPVETQKPA